MKEGGAATHVYVLQDPASININITTMPKKGKKGTDQRTKGNVKVSPVHCLSIIVIFNV